MLPDASARTVQRICKERGLNGWEWSISWPQEVFWKIPSKRKAGLCGRRSGKTDVVARKLLSAAIGVPADAYSVYIARSRPHAKRNIWGKIKRLAADWGVDVEWNEAEMSGRVTGGGVIWVTGCATESDIEVFRGLAYIFVAVDECASFPLWLGSCVLDALEPATLDYDGEIWLMGTPGPVLVGFFYDVTTGGVDGWSTHTWTAADNPFFGDRYAEWLEHMRLANGWDAQHPTLLREYFAQWVKDDNALIYAGLEKNQVENLPVGVAWRYVISIDCGFVDATVLMLLAWAPGFDVHICETRVFKSLVPSQLGAKIEELRGTKPVGRIVVDTQGVGKAYAEEVRKRYKLPIFAAAKTDKIANVRILSGEVHDGRLKVIRGKNADLLSETAVLTWDDKRQGIDERCVDHCCDTFLYGWRCCYHWQKAETEKAEPTAADKAEAYLRDQAKAARGIRERRHARVS